MIERDSVPLSPGNPLRGMPAGPKLGGAFSGERRHGRFVTLFRDQRYGIHPHSRRLQTEAYRRKGERYRCSDLILASIAAVATAPWPLSAHPFREVGPVGHLIDRGLPPDAWLSSCGVYAVIVPPGYEFRVLDFPIVAEAQNVLVPLSADRLRAKWVPGTRVVYIGLAGNTNPRTLRQQLKDMIHHAAGETTDRGPHRKGESAQTELDE